MRRPEYFSDSKVTYDVILTKEVLAYELEKISTNQKQDLFENFCRQIAERVIAPNLIPQTGPTGGGDGKTDAETYPVSEEISERWFIPENGWNKNEKWAFAISSKKTWKPKADSDIKSILSTDREYTRIYFISNQTISSKKRKEAQDHFIEKYKIDVIILDGIWILEEVFKNNFIDIAVDSLNLSSVYKQSKKVQGANDVEREQFLLELEEKIQNPNRYSAFDFQKVEDSIEAAIIARKLEKPRDEVEGKFDRAIRFCKKTNLKRHWLRIHYQKAWTYLYYYDDYPLFIEEFKAFKQFISLGSSADQLELYTNLFSSLRGFCNENCDINKYDIDINIEKEELYSLLEKVSEDDSRPYTSLKVRIDLLIQQLMDCISDDNESEVLITKLYESIKSTVGMIEFPFESYHQIFEELGNLFPDSLEYDKLIELVASIAEKRSSELTAGRVFLQRAGQKYSRNYVKESVVFFGRAILKLAKEETEHELCLALTGLGYAFNGMGLYWASNNCFISASFIAFKSWHQSGIIDKRTFSIIKQLAINELLLGRIPSFLTWYELLCVIKSQVEIEESQDEIPTLEMLDAFLSVRIANTNSNENQFAKLPDILESQTLWLAQNAALFKLGHSEIIIDEYKKLDISTTSQLYDYFNLIANQPFRQQMVYKTNFVSEEEIIIKSKILGCSFEYHISNDVELVLAAELFASFFENYLSTSITSLAAKTEKVEIWLTRKVGVDLFEFTSNELGTQFFIEIDSFSFPREKNNALQDKMVELTSQVLANNFITNDIEQYLKHLYENEELNERLAFVYEHRNFSKNILGDNPKLFYEDWTGNAKNYELKLGELQKFSIKEEETNISEINPEHFKPSRHDDNKVISIIEDKLWDKATWKGFGPFFAPNIGYGIFLLFENGEAAKSIFENWIEKFGKEDKENIIKITLIKGVKKNNPFWYKVHITANMEVLAKNSKERFFNVTARFHQMTPNNSENMKRIEQIANNKLLFCPAQMTKDGKDIIPLFDKGIVKYSIEIKNAWELGMHDPAGVAILEDDDPIIPSEVKNAPVLEILKK